MGSKAADKEMSFLAGVLLNFSEAANQGRFHHFLLSSFLADSTLCCGRFIYLFFLYSLAPYDIWYPSLTGKRQSLSIPFSFFRCQNENWKTEHPRPISKCPLILLAGPSLPCACLDSVYIQGRPEVYNRFLCVSHFVQKTRKCVK